MIKKKKSLPLPGFFLLLILFLSAFFRLYRLDQLLGFWYDQGRDALIIWKLIHYKNFFLIGPVTGIDGIFLGPFYYYLIAPFYWLGRGSPVFVATILSWLTIGAIFLIYYLARQIFNRKTGLIAAVLYGLSYNLVLFSRWLANPNPLPFFTLLAMVCLCNFIFRQKPFFLILYSFLIGLCLQLEAAAAVWFLPATLIILIWQKSQLKSFKIIFWSILAFLTTLLPQVIFNYRHNGVLAEAFKSFLLAEKSFNLSLRKVILIRLKTYFEVFGGKIFPGQKILMAITIVVFLLGIIIFEKRIFSKGGKLLFLWLAIPLIGFFFYQGNHGYVWDYYFTGVIPSFMILFAAVLENFFKKGNWGKILTPLFLIIFTAVNLKELNKYYANGVGITLGAELRAIDWIYQDANGDDFNFDAYVPPQIYFSYSYLFRWYGKSKYKYEPIERLVINLYTIHEPDSERPFLLNQWLQRQDGIGRITDRYSWGGVSVEKRFRFQSEERNE